MPSTFPSGSLCERTQYLVKTRPANVTYRDLARLAEVKPRWIESFVQGKVPDPSCPRVERLYKALTGKTVFGE